MKKISKEDLVIGQYYIIIPESGNWISKELFQKNNTFKLIEYVGKNLNVFDDLHIDDEF